MAPLLGDSDAGGRRDILEGRMIWVVHQVLSSGSSVVLDLGCIPPSAAELAHDPVPAAPSGHESWVARAGRRWPTLPRLDLSPLPERLSHDRPT